MPKLNCLISLILFFSTLSLSSYAEQCNPNDKKVLLRIKSHFNNAPIFAAWNSNSDCCTSWGGIVCDAGRVITIAIGRDNTLVGDIPSAMGDLPFLQYLAFSDFPGLTGPIPSALSKLTKLNYVDLSSNNLTGPIPIYFAEGNLTALDVSNNKFTGDGSFLFGGKKTVLTSIKISNNLFKFDFTNVDLSRGLKTIDISHNMIHGSLPIKLGQLPLQSIDVSFNRLCGPIPTGRRLKQFSPVKFSNNKCLCGRPLAACKS